MTTASATAVAERHARATGVDLYRACALCDHGPAHNGRPGACTRYGDAVSVPVARSRDGFCGPNAAHLRINAWDLT